MIKLTLPIDDNSRETLTSLRAGDFVRLSGTIYTARDQAHKRLVEALSRGEALPFDPKGAAIYYCGPTPPREDGLFGSAGPTTSARMDPFAPRLYEAGVAVTIGKGNRADTVREACAKFGAVYLIAYGGAGAYLASRMKSQRVTAYPDLGAEAVYEIVVEDFPAIVGFDTKGGSFFG
jgi:fumarate hydratase subunit beta